MRKYNLMKHYYRKSEIIISENIMSPRVMSENIIPAKMILETIICE